MIYIFTICRFTWSFNVNALHNNLRNFSNFSAKIAGLEPYKGRISFICGNQSNFVEYVSFIIACKPYKFIFFNFTYSPDSWPEIQKLFPNSEIHWLDAGHLVHFDQPSKFIDLVSQFLNK